jgi:hypothetical protein
MLPGTVDGMKHICYFRHALALDERRVKFLPEYAYGGSATPPTKPEDKRASPINHESPHDDHKSPSPEDADGPITNNEPSDDRPPVDNEVMDPRSSARIKSLENRPHTIEVWFAGTHSDM